MINRTDFEKKLQSLADQGQMLTRICASRNVDDLTRVIEEESQRLIKETTELNKQGKETGII